MNKLDIIRPAYPSIPMRDMGRLAVGQWMEVMQQIFGTLPSIN